MTHSTPENEAPALRFPPEFVWGAATSSYQIEGSLSAMSRIRNRLEVTKS